MAEQPAVEVAPEPVDIGQVKTMLNLPETAKDVDVISSLIELIAVLQQKYDALLSDAIELEDKVANRDLQDFEDLVTQDTRDFWKEQLMRNREGTLGVLSGIRQAQEVRPAPLPEPQPEAERRPLFRNRLIHPARTMEELAGEVPAVSITRAVKIRNRAQEIRVQEKIPYAQAFNRAEKEIE